MDEWDTVEAEVARIIAESAEPFTAGTISQINDFLKYLRERTAPPMVGRGYWPSLWVAWESKKELSFEVYDDRIEIYHSRYRDLRIRHISHVVGEPFPDEIGVELPPT
jgi:hypothetical protein